MSKHWEQNKDATVYVGNIDERFNQELLSELMTQVGPVRQVHMPQDRVSQTHQGYGFVEFDTAESADYASKVLNGIRVWGKPIRVNKASADKQKAVDIGAELFVNNLDPMVDEKILYDTFGQFGQILRQPNIIRDDNNISKGYGFVSFDSFEASDAARDTMNGQYLLSKQITVEYAYKKDGKGERHGDEAERKLAAEGKKHNIVPEQQVLPPAFHMTAAQAATTPSIPNGPPPGLHPDTNIPPAGLLPPTGPGIPPIPSPMPVGLVPQGFPIPPPQAPSSLRTPHPLLAAQMGGIPPPPQLSLGMRPVPPGLPQPSHPGLGLPPAPSGLPARPPPSHAGFGGPADFHPGGGAAPPPFRGGPAGSPVYPGGIPPPAGAFPPPNGVPGGFAPPPPGFGPPGGGRVPPPGTIPPPPSGFGGHHR